MIFCFCLSFRLLQAAWSPPAGTAPPENNTYPPLVNATPEDTFATVASRLSILGNMTISGTAASEHICTDDFGTCLENSNIARKCQLVSYTFKDGATYCPSGFMAVGVLDTAMQLADPFPNPPNYSPKSGYLICCQVN